MIGGLIALLIALSISLAIRDAWGWLPPVSRAVLRLATAFLPRDRRAVRREELHNRLIEKWDDRRLTGLLWAGAMTAPCIWEAASGLVIACRQRLARRRLDEPVAVRSSGAVVVRSAALMSATLTATCVGLAAHDLLRLSTALAVLTGIAFGMMTWVLDCSYLPAVAGRRGLGMVAAVAPRLLLALLLAVTLTTPLMLRIFAPEVGQQVARDRDEARTAAMVAVDRRWQPRMAVLEKERADVLAELHVAERSGTFRLEDTTKHTLRRVEREIDSARHERTVDRRDVANAYTSAAGLLDQVKALGELRARDSSSAYTVWFLTLLLMTIYALPGACVVLLGVADEPRGRPRT